MGVPNEIQHDITARVQQQPTPQIAPPASPQLEKAPKEDAKGDDIKNSQPTEKAKLKNYLRILSYGTALDYVMMIVGALCSIAAGATLPLMNIVFGKLVGTFTGYFMIPPTIDKTHFVKNVNKQALYIVFLFIAKFVCAYISTFTFRLTGIRISAAIRLAYLRALFSQSIGYVDRLPAGTVTSRITNSANTLQLGISEKLGMMVQFTSLLVTAFIVSFTYSWKMTLVNSSVIPFIMLVYSVTVPFQVKLTRSIEHAVEKASSLAGEVFGSIRTVVAFGGEARLGKKYAEWIQEGKRRGLKLAPFLGAQFAPLFFSIYAAFGLAFWFGVRLYSRHEIHDVGTVIIVFFSVLMAVMSIGNIVAPVTAIVKATSASTELFATIDTPVPNTAGLKEPEASADADVTFNDVTFAYPSRPGVKVLDNLNVRFEAGKITAIVGPSGSGKSTIVGLLERWYDLRPEAYDDRVPSQSSGPDQEIPIENSGSITVGRHDIYELDLKWWRSQIGLVQQEPFLFNDTIVKNVAHSLVGSKWESEDQAKKLELVKEACIEAFANEFIDKLPEGYETKVGESGIKLSGGQRQRIAIARSIIKRPPVLILDEATSSIDVRGERIVQEALDRVSKDRTTIMIAHRLSTIKKADKIVVLKKGKVVQEGTHEGLLEDEDGAYYHLVHAQALSMQEQEPEEVETGMSMHSSLQRTRTGESLLGRRDTNQSLHEPEAPSDFKERGIVGSFGLLLYEQRHHWMLYMIIVLSAMGAGAAYPLQAYLMARLIEVFQYFGGKLIHGGNFWSLMFLVQAICVGTFYLVLGWSSHATSVFVSSTYRQQYFDGIIRKRIAFFDAEENSGGSLVSRVSTDPAQLEELMGTNMAMVLIAGFNVLGCVIIAFTFGWKLTLVALFAAMPAIFLAGFLRVRFEIQFEKLNAAVFAESSQFATEAIGAFRTVSSLTLEDTICDRYQKLLTEQQRKAFNKAKLTTVIFALSDSMELLCMALCFWYGGRLLSTREYDVVKFFTIYVAVVQGGQAAGMFCSFAPNMAQAAAAANRILSLRTIAVDDGKSADGIQKVEGGVEIEFKGVHFRYPTRPIQVFAGLSMKIERGQFAALVGPSGCGKTTTISLLERFYDIEKGSITFDGKNISDLEMRAYRNSISLVAQEPTLYQGSIRENIMLAVDEGSVTEEDIHQACRDAEIHEFITSLPDGYNTDVGSKGVALSGGQKQRIAIARALIRQPRVLLLDEATSSLDSESEKLVQGAFERAGKGRTMIVVAHRLATIQNADVIFVFGDGKILEQGNHRTLLQKRGIYYQMCQSQALDR